MSDDAKPHEPALSADGLDQLTIKGIAHTAWTADLVA